MSTKITKEQQERLKDAVKSGSLNALNALLAEGVSPNTKILLREQYPLVLACEYGHYQIVERLLEAGASVNVSDKDHFTALSYAVDQKHYDIVELLLKKGADIRIKDQYGNTILHFVLSYCNNFIDVVPLLFQYGAKDLVHVKGYENKTPLDIFFSKTDNEKCIEEFVKAYHESDLLVMATTNNRVDIVEKYILAGGDVNATTNLGSSVFLKYYLVLYYHQIMKLIVQNKLKLRNYLYKEERMLIIYIKIVN
jgi:ankyrin repeat protein